MLEIKCCHDFAQRHKHLPIKCKVVSCIPGTKKKKIKRWMTDAREQAFKHLSGNISTNLCVTVFQMLGRCHHI